MLDPSAVTVLIADDDPDARDSLGKVLELMLPGVRTVFAVDGLDAVSVALDICPWAVILDLGMPRMDGLDAAQRLQARMGKEMPILIAASGDYKRLRESYDVFDYSLRKPIDLPRLARYLARAMVFASDGQAARQTRPD
ncbi:MAG: response regulator [Caldimonas sp.]